VLFALPYILKTADENNKIYGSLRLWIWLWLSSKKNACELSTHKHLNNDKGSYLTI